MIIVKKIKNRRTLPKMTKRISNKLLSLACSLIIITTNTAISAETRYELVPSTNVLEKSSRRQITRYRVINEKKSDVIEITSDHWHGGGMIVKLKQGKWPRRLFIHLRTSESDAYEMLARLSLVTSTFRVFARYHRRKQSFVMQKLDSASGNWLSFSKVKVKMRYKKSHMQIQIPPELLVDNPAQIRIAWIYMYSLH